MSLWLLSCPPARTDSHWPLLGSSTCPRKLQVVSGPDRASPVGPALAHPVETRKREQIARRSFSLEAPLDSQSVQFQRIQPANVGDKLRRVGDISFIAHG